MCSNCLLIIITFVLHACFYVFDWENVYFLDPTDISHTNLFKRLLHVIVTTCKISCADAFKSKNPGLYDSNAKLGPLKYASKDILRHICPSKKYHIWTFMSLFKQDKYNICPGFELHLSSFEHVCLRLNRTNITFVLDLNYICPHLSWVQMHHYPVCRRDKCHICPPTKHRQMWQMSYLIYIWATFVFG